MRETISNAPLAGLRGDYRDAGADYYVVEQRWSEYGEEEHALWRRPYRRQMTLLPGYACEAYRDSLAKLDASAGIPQLEQINRALYRASGWTLVAVPGLIPGEVRRHDSLRPTGGETQPGRLMKQVIAQPHAETIIR